MTAALRDIDATLNAHSTQLRSITDSQYKLINETILAVLQTTDQAKVDYLKNVVRNALNADDLIPHEAALLSRAVRDISAQEVDFLVRNFHYEKIEIVRARGEREANILQVLDYSPDGQVVPGLISLGILVSAGNTYDDVGCLRFLPVTAKLLALLKSGA